MRVHNSNRAVRPSAYARADAKPALGVSTAEWTASGPVSDWRCPDPGGRGLVAEPEPHNGRRAIKRYICTIVTLNEDGAFDLHAADGWADKPLPTLSLEQRDSGSGSGSGSGLGSGSGSGSAQAQVSAHCSSPGRWRALNAHRALRNGRPL